MNIGLMAVDSVYPNLALMKISSWHKAKGDCVEWYNTFDEYDVVYMSKVFSFTEDYGLYMTNAKEIRKGGTGYSLSVKLDEAIEFVTPDYSIYPKIDDRTAYGFLTRGCPNRCKWCVVPRKDPDGICRIANHSGILGTEVRLSRNGKKIWRNGLIRNRYSGSVNLRILNREKVLSAKNISKINFDTMRLRVFTAFSGYDSQCMALDKLGIEYELVGWSEIDKYAIQAHNAVYPQWAERNFGDISKIDWVNVPDFDLFTYSFPCQDISSAGKQRGLQKGSETRSSLLWECQKAIEAKRPKYCLMENVAALVSEKFRPFFLEWERLMCRYGYSNYNRILDSKDYGIPQHRERIFMVSILDPNKAFYWPEPMKLEKRLKDVLEQNVDEKYYLSDKLVNYVFSNGGVNKNIQGGEM